jgi:DNA topoisomerase-2
VCLSPTGSFQSVSFVNGVATPRGGTHVSHVAAPLFAALAPQLSRALKLPPDEALKPSKVKQQLMLFVNATVDNPEFDSQAKETLTSPPEAFGELCTLPESFVRRVAKLRGLKDSLSSERTARDAKALISRVGSRSTASLDIPKLEDAELAGGARSHECTLILTEGDSAKALAVAGLEIVGRRTYGVFPCAAARASTHPHTSAHIHAHPHTSTPLPPHRPDPSPRPLSRSPVPSPAPACPDYVGSRSTCVTCR